MNKREKEVLEETLKNEKKVLKELDKVYAEALTEIDDKISQLLARDDGNMQNVIYQVEYQKALKQQIESAIDTLHSKEFTSVSEYLTDCYNTGFIGTMYNLHGQNIPLMIPIDQEQVVQAITKDTKLSESLYNSLGKDIKTLKKQIASELSVGIATAQSYADIHRNIATVAGINKNKAMRIARTEGHRIQQTAAVNACNKAVEKGADIVKQWSAALDGRTRDSHRHVDGEITELDKPFSNGLMYPGDPNGPAAEVVNCRCTISQRAKWRLDNEELERLKVRAGYFGLDKTENFNDYKSKYLKFNTKILKSPSIGNVKIEQVKEEFRKILSNSKGADLHVTKMGMYADYTDYIEDVKLDAPFAYDSNADVIRYNPKASRFSEYDLNYVQTHELSHRMDCNEYESYKNSKFLKAIDVCSERVLENKSEIQQWFDEGGKYENSFAICDIINALSKGEIETGIGHPDSYWKKSIDNIPLEVFADISSIDVLDDKSKVEFESLLKELYESYMEMVE